MNSGRRQLDFLVAHDLINKLSIIVGHCDLLKQELPENSTNTEHLHLIQDAAKSVVKELRKYQSNSRVAANKAVRT